MDSPARGASPHGEALVNAAYMIYYLDEKNYAGALITKPETEYGYLKL